MHKNAFHKANIKAERTRHDISQIEFRLREAANRSPLNSVTTRLFTVTNLQDTTNLLRRPGRLSDSRVPQF